MSSSVFFVLLLSADPRSLFEKARALEQAQQWVAAEAAYREFLQASPSSAEGHGNLGVVLSRQGKFEAAIGAYSGALKLRPSLVELRLNLGLAYYKSDRHEQAIAEFRRYLQAKPGDRQAGQLLATALLETDRYAEAARLFESLAASGDFSVRLGLAASYLRLQRPEARPMLEELLRQEDTPEVQLLLGQAHLAANEFVPAEAAFRRAVALRPETSGAHFLLGAVAWKRQDAPAAIAEWREERKRDPQNFEAAFALGAALAEKGETAEARTVLEMALVLRPRHAPALYYLGRLRRSRALLERAVQLDPSIRPAHYLLAQIYRAQGLTAEADRELAAVRRLSQSGVQEDIDIVQSARPIHGGPR